jgi:hypothetical protein
VPPAGVPPGPPDPSSGPPDARASDADREAALARLRAATVDGRLTVDELAERAGLAHSARTLAELAAVTADLGAETAVRLSAPVDRGAPVAGVLPTDRTFLALARRRGRRALPARSRFTVTLGNLALDLRDVVIPGPEVDIELHTVLGWVQVVVPEGIEVRLVGDGVLTNREVHLRTVPVPPGAPVVRLHVSGFLGSVSVRSRPRRRG